MNFCRNISWLLLCGVLQAHLLAAATWTETFAADPFANGWKIFGDPGLFQWNAPNQNLAVTWDSARANSYFYQPLGTILTKADDFGFSFELQLADLTNGLNPGKPYTFELAAGFINRAVATSANYQRGLVTTNNGARNLCEFDYFPDSGFGATISPTMISTNSQYSQFATVFAYPLELDPGALFVVTLNYTASNKTLRTVMTRNGDAFGPIPDVVLGAGFKDFRLDQFAVSSYCDAGADGSLLAHGVVDNLVVTVPPPPVQNLTGNFTNGIWQAQFLSRSNWQYTLERTATWQSWTNVSPTIFGNSTNLFLSDPNPPMGQAFYRVRGERP